MGCVGVRGASMDMKSALDVLEKATEKTAHAKKASEKQDMGFAIIERLCLIRDDITISIPNIARLTTDQLRFAAIQKESEWVNFIRLAAVLLGITLAVLVANAWGVIIAIVCVIAAFRYAANLPLETTKDATVLHRLTVHTNDGGKYLFSTFNKELIGDLRRIITDKMNGQDETAVYNINFEQGVIQNMDIGKIGSVGAIVTGQGNQVNAAAGNARVNTVENITTMIDYSQVIPVLGDWKVQLERSNFTDAATRIDELQTLLKTGTPTQDQKFKLRDLLDTLTSMFTTSTQAIQLFDTIRRLAGL